jgi:hypothetical protein
MDGLAFRSRLSFGRDEESHPMLPSKVSRSLRFNQSKRIVISCLAVLLLAGAKPASAAPILSVSPSSVDVIQGTTVTVDFLINQAVDLYAFQFGVSFDPNVLTALTVTEGSFLSSAGTGNFVEGFVDNDLGTILFNANTLSGLVPGIDGSGTLLSVTFGAEAIGSSAISILFDSLQLDDLLDSNLASMLIDPETGEYVAPSVVNGTVRVSATPTTPVPEPSTLMMLAIGATSAVAARRRRRQLPLDRTA